MSSEPRTSCSNGQIAVTGLTPAEIDFLTHLTSQLLKSCQRREFDNTDRVRFPSPRSSFKIPSPSSFKIAVKEKLIQLAAKRGFYRASVVPVDVLKDILKTNGLAHAYGLLEDQYSKDLFVKLLAYRILGYRHVRLPLNNARYWELRRSLDQYVEKRDAITNIPILGSLDLCNFNGIRLQVHRFAILQNFLLEQYRWPRAAIGVKRDDVVIDAGGCWGDTALYFAQDAAQVFCFECMPSNIRILEGNLALNPSLATKINLVQKALWRRSGERLVFEDTGPGSRCSSEGTGVDVETQSLDDFVITNSLERVDFIKMDIEGSESEALIGAERTIRKYRPQLAVCLYHDIRDFASIPNWIASLNLGYRFYIGHFTIHAEETVLFARSGD
jgi:FkbM family methyltransferase